jgi:hypothetical protein
MSTVCIWFAGLCAVAATAAVFVRPALDALTLAVIGILWLLIGLVLSAVEKLRRP